MMLSGVAVLGVALGLLVVIWIAVLWARATSARRIIRA